MEENGQTGYVGKAKTAMGRLGLTWDVSATQLDKVMF